MARTSYKRILIYIIITPLLLISSFWYFFAFVPMQVAASHEQAYFDDLYGVSSHHTPYRETDTSDPGNEAAAPQKTPLLPLIRNVFQISSFSWESELRLNVNGTAKYPMQRRWIYVGGTPALPRTWREKLSLVSPPGKGSCVDSPSICSSFNDGFNTIVANSHGPDPAKRTRTTLNFFDCDNSPILCDIFRVNPVRLLYLETKLPCFVRKDYSFECSKRWTYISLPLKKLPFERKMWMNGMLVPVFPSALEQLRSLILWEGSLDSLGSDEGYFLETLAGKEEDGFVFEGVERGSDEYDKKLQEVAQFLAYVLNR